MTYRHFMNAQEMLKCSEKHPVSIAKNGNTKKVVIARWSTKWNFFCKTIFYKYRRVTFIKKNVKNMLNLAL